MKRIILIALLAPVLSGVQAQQLQTASLYDLQGVFHNPAMAGTQATNVFGASYRSQWSGISGSPQTATVFASFGLPEQKIGIGGYLYRDQTGPTSRTGIQVAFAKHIPTGNGGKFSLGIEARGLQFGIDREKLTATLGADPAIGTAENRFKFDAGFGLSYTDKNWQIGVSASQLIQSQLDFYTGNLTRSEEGRLYRHYYLHGAYNWQVDKSTTIMPHFLVIYLPNAPTEYQAGVRVEHNQLLWWGLGFRARQSITASAGVHITPKFTLGYGFDIYQNPLSVFAAGGLAHEFLIRYNLARKK